MLSAQILIDVHDLPTSFHVWDKLQPQFMHSSMTPTLELKQMLTNISKGDNQMMDTYLQEINSIVDNLALVNSPVPHTDCSHYALMSLCQRYKT